VRPIPSNRRKWKELVDNLCSWCNEGHYYYHHHYRERYFGLQNSWPFITKFLPSLLLGVSASYCQRALDGWIRND
jgi:hypothetical protein